MFYVHLFVLFNAFSLLCLYVIFIEHSRNEKMIYATDYDFGCNGHWKKRSLESKPTF